MSGPSEPDPRSNQLRDVIAVDESEAEPTIEGDPLLPAFEPPSRPPSCQDVTKEFSADPTATTIFTDDEGVDQGRAR